jgi:hypothetical protein
MAMQTTTTATETTITTTMKKVLQISLSATL